jgi:hypothetical protein
MSVLILQLGEWGEALSQSQVILSCVKIVV